MMLALKDLDFLDFESSLGMEERTVRDTVQRFVNERVLPDIEKHYREGTCPLELYQAMGKLGFLGCSLQGYGCAGLSSLAYGLLQQELEAGDAAIRSMVSVQSSLCMYAIHTFGSEAQKQKWLPLMAKGEKIGCFGLTESDFGSNPSGMRTKAERTATGYRLNGSKMWITNGSVADVAIVWAKLEGTIHGFLVEKGTNGFQAQDIHNKHSLRASITSELSFDDCDIPKDSLLPHADGLKGPLSCLAHARFGVAWGALGSARSCFYEAKEYALSRKQFRDQPIASHQLVQAKLSQMLMEITKAQALTFQVTKLKESGKFTPVHSSMIKMNNTEMSLQVARAARSILGANGISGEYPIMRHMCNLETTVTYEGTTDIHLLTIGKEITGISAF
ncbi:acyl-CoA dehydrogenase family protein [Deltaproteobacteria bacterium TL4]